MHVWNFILDFYTFLLIKGNFNLKILSKSAVYCILTPDYLLGINSSFMKLTKMYKLFILFEFFFTFLFTGSEKKILFIVDLGRNKSDSDWTLHGTLCSNFVRSMESDQQRYRYYWII